MKIPAFEFWHLTKPNFVLISEFSPTNRVEVNKFLIDFNWEKTPLGGYVVVQRQVKEERARILRESLLEDEEERKKAKEVKDMGGDSEDEDVDEAMEDLESSEAEEDEE